MFLSPDPCMLVDNSDCIVPPTNITVDKENQLSFIYNDFLIGENKLSCLVDAFNSVIMMALQSHSIETCQTCIAICNYHHLLPGGHGSGVIFTGNVVGSGQGGCVKTAEEDGTSNYFECMSVCQALCCLNPECAYAELHEHISSQEYFDGIITVGQSLRRLSLFLPSDPSCLPSC